MGCAPSKPEEGPPPITAVALKQVDVSVPYLSPPGIPALRRVPEGACDVKVVRGARDTFCPKASHRPVTLEVGGKPCVCIKRGRVLDHFCITDAETGEPLAYVHGKLAYKKKVLVVNLYTPTGGKAGRDDEHRPVYPLAQIDLGEEFKRGEGDGTFGLMAADGEIGIPVWRRQRYFHDHLGAGWSFTSEVETSHGDVLCQCDHPDRARVAPGVDLVCLAAFLWGTGVEAVGAYDESEDPGIGMIEA